jgi:hypothetical protein
LIMPPTPATSVATTPIMVRISRTVRNVFTAGA